MVHLTDTQLERFQLNPEAFYLAKQIHGHWVQVKTAPRSGHDLGAGVIAVSWLVSSAFVSTVSALVHE